MGEIEEIGECWEKNEEIAEKLANCYYGSILEEYKQEIEKSSKEDFGFNAFVDGIRVGLDIVIPLLDEKFKKIVEERISFMINKRESLNLKNIKISKVKCDWCGKEMECPENMKNEKQMCYECFKKLGYGINKEIGKAHIDFPMNEVKKDLPNFIASGLAREIFPQVWKEQKEELKEISRKEACEKMFLLGVENAAKEFLSQKEMEKNEII